MAQKFTQQEIDKHNRLTQEAWKILNEYILLHNKPEKKIGFWAKRKLNKAIGLFQKALEIAPNKYSSKWGIGKIFQTLEQHQESLTWFEAAYALKKDNPDVCREASLAALDSQDYEKALKYSLLAIKLSPNNAGLHCNQALIYMFLKRDKEAVASLELALRLEADDEITIYVGNILKGVIAGKKNRPKTMNEL